MIKPEPSPLRSHLSQTEEAKKLISTQHRKILQKQGMRQKAKKLRQNKTKAEELFWNHVRAKRFLGFKFRCRHPIEKYIAGFCCIKLKLIIELDSEQYCENEKDKARTLFLESKGFEIIRFYNHEALQNIEGVLSSLSLALSRRERELANPKGKSA